MIRHIPYRIPGKQFIQRIMPYSSSRENVKEKLACLETEIVDAERELQKKQELSAGPSKYADYSDLCCFVRLLAGNYSA